MSFAYPHRNSTYLSNYLDTNESNQNNKYTYSQREKEFLANYNRKSSKGLDTHNKLPYIYDNVSNQKDVVEPIKRLKHRYNISHNNYYSTIEDPRKSYFNNNLQYPPFHKQNKTEEEFNKENANFIKKSRNGQGNSNLKNLNTNTVNNTATPNTQYIRRKKIDVSRIDQIFKSNNTLSKPLESVIKNDFYDNILTKFRHENKVAPRTSFNVPKIKLNQKRSEEIKKFLDEKERLKRVPKLPLEDEKNISTKLMQIKNNNNLNSNNFNNKYNNGNLIPFSEVKNATDENLDTNSRSIEEEPVKKKENVIKRMFKPKNKVSINTENTFFSNILAKVNRKPQEKTVKDLGYLKKLLIKKKIANLKLLGINIDPETEELENAKKYSNSITRKSNNNLRSLAKRNTIVRSKSLRKSDIHPLGTPDNRRSDFSSNSPNKSIYNLLHKAYFQDNKSNLSPKGNHRQSNKNLHNMFQTNIAKKNKSIFPPNNNGGKNGPVMIKPNSKAQSYNTPKLGESESNSSDDEPDINVEKKKELQNKYKKKKSFLFCCF